MPSCLGGVCTFCYLGGNFLAGQNYTSNGIVLWQDCNGSVIRLTGLTFRILHNVYFGKHFYIFPITGF